MTNFLFKKHLNFKVLFILALQIAGVVELVDTLDLGSSAARCESSSLSARTESLSEMRGFYYCIYNFEKI